jgi:ethanolamine transporter EutH
MRKAVQVVKASIRTLISAVLFIAVTAKGKLTALATDIGSSQIATGTQRLLNDLTTWLLVIAPIAGTVCIIFFAIKRGMADEQDQKQWTNRIITAAVSVAIAVLASVIIKLVVSYYGE